MFYPLARQPAAYPASISRHRIGIFHPQPPNRTPGNFKASFPGRTPHSGETPHHQGCFLPPLIFQYPAFPSSVPVWRRNKFGAAIFGAVMTDQSILTSRGGSYFLYMYLSNPNFYNPNKNWRQNNGAKYCSAKPTNPSIAGIPTFFKLLIFIRGAKNIQIVQ